MTVRDTASTARAIVRIATPSPARMAASTALAVAAASATVGLLATSGLLIDRAALRPALYTLTVLMAAVQILALARGPLRYLERLVSHDTAFHVLARLRLWFFDRLVPLAPAGLARLPSGDILVRATDDIDALQDLFLRGISPVVVAVSVSALAVGLVAAFDPGACLVLGLALLAGLVGPPALALAAGRAGKREAALRGSLGSAIVDLLQGAPDLVAFGTAQAYLDQALEADRALTALARKRSFAAGAVNALTMACTGAGIVGVLVAGISAARAHTMAPVLLGILPLVALGAFEVVPPVTDALLHLAGQLGAANRLLEVAEIEAPVVEPSDGSLRLVGASPLPAPPDTPTASRGRVRGPGVTFDHVTLCYEPHGVLALDDVQFEVPGGRHVAVVGPSGSGKTSLTNTLLGFWPLSAGRILLDGVPTDELGQDQVRRIVGLLSQDAHLFATTIGRNISLGRPDATAEEIAEVVRLAQLEEWLRSLPLGLDTPVGERATQVSGGQRQRIALARTLLTDPAVLVLDEPTAGLDEPTADQLLADVSAAAAGRTVLLVTHRSAELGFVDDVVELDRGRVVRQRPALASKRAQDEPPISAMVRSTACGRPDGTPG